MKKSIYLLILFFYCTTAFAQQSNEILKADSGYNGGFETVAQGRQLPDQWHLMYSHAGHYNLRVDHEITHTGNNAIFISSVDTVKSPQFAGIGCQLPAKYQGKKITLNAWMKSADMQGSLGLMLGIYDSNGKILQFENLQDKKLKGSKEWKQYSVTLPMPDEAQSIQIGPLLIGKGKLWIDDIEVLIDGNPLNIAKQKVNFNPNPPRIPQYGSNDSVGKFVNLKDAKIYYEVYGTGEPLLLLHGNSQSINAFAKQIPDLAKKYKVIAVDSRGQGKSTDESEGPLSYDEFANDMKVLLDSLHINKTNILGWSDGGNTGLIMAVKYPSYVKRLAVTGAVLSPTSDAVDAKVLKSVKQQLDEISAVDDRSVKRKRLMTLLLNEPHITIADLKAIKAPTLIMAGERDIIKEKHTRTIAENIAGSKLIIFEDASHDLPIEKVKEFNEAVIGFFNLGL